MAKRLVLLGGLLFLMIPGMRAANIDSLRAVAVEQPDSLKVDTWLDMSYYFAKDSLADSAMRYADMGMQMADSMKDTSHIRDAYFRMGQAYGIQGDTLMKDSLYQIARTYQAWHGFELRNYRNSFNNAYEYDYMRNTLGVWKDSLNVLTFDSVRRAGFGEGFRPNVETGALDHSMVYWVRFRLQGHSDSAENVLFMVGVDNASWDTVDAYIPDDQGRYHRYRSGLRIPPEEKTGIKDWRNMFTVPLDTNESKIIYLRLSHISSEREPDDIQ
ncbi:MAG: 7TM-DISM domain-containing protein [Bacteroidota bacterium]